MSENNLFLQVVWNAPRNVKALVTTAKNDLNLAIHVNDDLTRVQKNRAILRSVLPSDPIWLNQTHSNDAVNIDGLVYEQDNIISADASYTTQKNQVAVIMTADCLPILLSNTTGAFVAAIHAGWKGLCNGIIEQTIKDLKQNPTEMVAFIGPAIAQECFEIGAEVREQFIIKDAEYEQFFKNSNTEGKYLGDLRAIAKHKLIQQGLQESNISNSKICTSCHSDWFFSYRKNNQTGRFATLAWIE